MDRRKLLIVVALLAALAYFTVGEGEPEKPRPRRPVCPGPDCPVPKPAPLPRPRKPWAEGEGSVGARRLGGPVAPDGTEVQIDLPIDQRIRNIGSHRDGAGMCVMSSIEMAARWAGLEQMRGLRDWCAQQPGGAYPAKVDRQLKEFCQAKGIECPPYLQYEGRDPQIIVSLLESGRMPAVTYTRAHMVCMVLLNEKYGTFLDNNRIGDNELVWMSPQEAVGVWAQGGNGWAFGWLTPPPPPPPRSE